MVLTNLTIYFRHRATIISQCVEVVIMIPARRSWALAEAQYFTPLSSVYRSIIFLLISLTEPNCLSNIISHNSRHLAAICLSVTLLELAVSSYKDIINFEISSSIPHCFLKSSSVLTYSYFN